MVGNETNTGFEKPIITIQNLSKSFNSKTVLNNISLAIPKNSICAIIGVNGAGKTTLLRIILEMLTFDKGNIDFSISKRKIALLPENDNLYEMYSGDENLSIFSSFFEIFNKENSIKWKEYIELLELSSSLNKTVSTYSKGMKRKLSLLVTLIRDTEILILDEPTSGIDPKSKVHIRNLFQKLKKEGKTILITSHDLAELEKISDYIAILDHGNILKVIENPEKNVNLEEEFFKLVSI